MNEVAAGTQRFGLGAIDQISFAVPDVNEALPRYAAMFGGPFAVVDVPHLDIICRGRPSTATLRLAFGRTGSLEVELVQVLAGDFPTLNWLADHGEGLHHLRYPVTDFASTQDAMLAAGFTQVMEGATTSTRFAYLESPLLNGMTIELFGRISESSVEVHT